MLEALADTPLVLVFEDLHWADDTLLDFVVDLADQTSDAALLVIATSRPELLDRRPGWGGGHRNSMVVSLARLSDGETADLLTALLETTLPGDELIARADGNPLYAEEYARLALEHGSEEELSVPPSLQALIAARLDTLPAEEKAVVQDAAVVGETAWTGAIAAIGSRSRAAAEASTRALERKQFLHRRRRSSIEGETEFTLTHAMVRDVAYQQIPRDERGIKHRAAAAWIESLGRRQDHAELLAHHYLQAIEFGGRSDDLVRSARDALRDAGERATALGAHEAAVRYFVSGLDLTDVEDPERPDLLLRSGRALYNAEIAGEAVLMQAARALTAAGNRLGAATAEALLGRLYVEEGRGDAARTSFAKARQLVEGLPASPQLCEVLAESCRFLMMANEYDEAVRVGDAALVMAAGLGLDGLRAHVLNSLAVVRVFGGDVAGGIGDLEEAIEIASRVGSPEAVRAYGNLGTVLAERVGLAPADEAKAAARREAERFGLRQQLRWMEYDLMDSRFFAGEWDGLVRGIDALVEERSLQTVSMLYLRSRVRLARGDGSGAASDAAHALEPRPRGATPAGAVGGADGRGLRRRRRRALAGRGAPARRDARRHSRLRHPDDTGRPPATGDRAPRPRPRGRLPVDAADAVAGGGQRVPGRRFRRCRRDVRASSAPVPTRRMPGCGRQRRSSPTAARSRPATTWTRRSRSSGGWERPRTSPRPRR